MPRKQTHSETSQSNGKIQRILLATFSVVFLSAGAIASWLPILNDGSAEFASGALLKVGVVLGVAWLAAPQLERFGWQRLRGTMLLGLLVVIALFAIRPKIGAVAGALFVGSTVFFSVLGWFRKLTKPPRSSRD